MKRFILGILLALPMIASAASTNTSAVGDSEASLWAQLFGSLQSVLVLEASFEANSDEGTDDGGNTPGGCGFYNDNTHRLPHECEEK